MLIVDEKLVKKSVDVLLKLLEQKDGKEDILESQKNINLTFSLKKIPKIKNKVIKLVLPHGLATPETDVCLFVKDLDKKSREYEETEFHYKDLLEDKGVKCVSQIIPIKALKIEYKPYEAKRDLSNRFDLFLADERIFGVLPPLLGKAFYGRKRLPVQVNLTKVNLKEEIHKAINNGRCLIEGRGSSYMATVAHTGLSPDQIVENIIQAAQQIASSIPGEENNIRNFYIKTPLSVSIPLYTSLGSSKDVTLPSEPVSVNRDVIEEIDTIMTGKVRVKLTGEVDLVASDGTIPSDIKRKAKLARLRTKAKKNKKVKRLRNNENKSSSRKLDSVKKSTKDPQTTTAGNPSKNISNIKSKDLGKKGGQKMGKPLDKKKKAR